ncbi:PorT family protein [Draconibacterium sp.]|nr:PorT family protein [Draconibacterium sp.]
MKKYLLIVGFIILGLTSHSQVLISLLLGDKLNSDGLEFGLEGGLNITEISGFEDTKSMSNFNLGFYFDIRMKDQFYLYTGVQVKSNYGMRNLTENDLEFLEAKTYPVEGKYKQKVSAFMVPILANYKFDNHWYVEVGPQLGLSYKGWVEFTSDVDNVETRIKDYNDNLLNWFNAGIAIGTGYKLLKGQGWTVGVRYYQGLTNAYKNRSGTLPNSFHLKVNIPIGAGKVSEKEG